LKASGIFGLGASYHSRRHVGCNANVEGFQNDLVSSDRMLEFEEFGGLVENKCTGAGGEAITLEFDVQCAAHWSLGCSVQRDEAGAPDVDIDDIVCLLSSDV
jgi:hypothetical protein